MSRGADASEIVAALDDEALAIINRLEDLGAKAAEARQAANTARSNRRLSKSLWGALADRGNAQNGRSANPPRRAQNSYLVGKRAEAIRLEVRRQLAEAIKASEHEIRLHGFGAVVDAFETTIPANQPRPGTKARAKPHGADKLAAYRQIEAEEKAALKARFAPKAEAGWSEDEVDQDGWSETDVRESIAIALNLEEAQLRALEAERVASAAVIRLRERVRGRRDLLARLAASNHVTSRERLAGVEEVLRIEANPPAHCPAPKAYREGWGKTLSDVIAGVFP